MKVLQVLPNLDSGGVERGTVEFARELVARGHQSIVMSNGGRLVKQLEAEGSRHIELPVHLKSLRSLRRGAIRSFARKPRGGRPIGPSWRARSEACSRAMYW